MELKARDRMGLFKAKGDTDAPGSLSGYDRLKNKCYNKGLAFSRKERQILGIHGLFPVVVKTLNEQINHCRILLNRLDNHYDKYMFLQRLSQCNERLFYNVLLSDIDEMLPLFFPSIESLAHPRLSSTHLFPKGLFITVQDKCHIYKVLKNWPENDVRGIVVTDGGHVRGAGDVGARGIEISIGKVDLYTAMARFQPNHLLPLCLDFGTNTQSLLEDPFYNGLQQKRLTGDHYYDIMDEFMESAVRRFGQNCIFHFEDFGTRDAFNILKKYRDTYCCFNNDIQGTAAASVAGIFAALKTKNSKIKNHTILSFGAGEVGIGIARLCLLCMEHQGCPKEEARKRIWLFDSYGLVVKNRPNGGLTEFKKEFAHKHAPITNLAEAVRVIKPTILIGASSKASAFSQEILETMAKNCDTPIIFALSTPANVAECRPEDVYAYTDGKCFFASGSKLDPIEYGGRIFRPGQCTNTYIFPGIGLGVVSAGMLTVHPDVFIIAAAKLADLCTDEDIRHGCLYPPMSMLPHITIEIAAKVMEYAYCKGTAGVWPEPEDKISYLKAKLYDLNYPSAIPEVYL